MKTAKITPSPLLVCSGGTTSRCAATGHWTLDLRKKYKQIDFDHNQKTVVVGGGISMAKLLDELRKYGRSFPTGLSSLPGVGYILTGGISPLSRSQGLAIDQIQQVKGIWGNGQIFTKNIPTNSSSLEDKIIWRGLCGAASFLGIVTELTLKTQVLTPIEIWQSLATKEQLVDAIKQAENWPNSMSLQWIWGERILVYVVVKSNCQKTNKDLTYFKKKFPCYNTIQISKVQGLYEMPPFGLPFKKQPQYKQHSEVISLLSPEWGSTSTDLIKSLSRLISNRPNPDCLIASQQLGGVSSQTSKLATSFIHRNSIWKPWINASWQAGNLTERDKSLKWLEEVWQTFEPNCPAVHAAQMHQHLPWHKKETKLAFGDWLPGLQDLKSQYDPNGILPAL